MMDDLIFKLRGSRSTVPIFNGRVTGVADTSRVVDERVGLAFPACYVTFLSEQAEPQPPGANENRQRIAQQWGIVVGLNAEPDVRGQHPAMSIEIIRPAIWRAIYNWAPPVRAGRRYGLLWYDSCKLLDINRAATYWLMTFGTHYWLDGACDGDEDQWELPDFLGINAKVDFIDPYDPGLPPSGETPPPMYDERRGPPPWSTGPEGRIELEIDMPFHPIRKPPP